MSRYQDVHFFIDESGDLEGKERKEVRLVGGIMLFGPYDHGADDARLGDILQSRLKEVGGGYPHDLHFFGKENKLSQDKGKMEAFLQKVRPDIASWAGRQREVCGVSIMHRRDIFEGGPRLLAEKEYDNRYIAMLWSLVEHLVFVDGRVHERLTPDARLHLHIANRRFEFDPREVSVEELTRMKMNPRPLTTKKGKPKKGKPEKYVVETILVERELLSMLRMAMRQRWPRTKFGLGKLEVRSIQYFGFGPAMMYLPDLYLGPLRLRELARLRKFKPDVRKTLVVDTFQELEYGPWMELQAQMQAALEDGDVDQYLSLAEEYEAGKGYLASPPHVASSQEKEAAGLLAQAPAKLVSFLEETCRVVDMPGRACEGHGRVERAERLLQGRDDLHARVLILQARLSHANHTGDIEAAAEVWKDYLRREPELPLLGLKGLQLRAEMRNRHAVSLTDRFLYDEAEKVIEPVIEIQEGIWKPLQEQFGQGKVYELGACWGTLGQVHAFRGAPDGPAEAEKCFRRAMAHFTAPQDIERQWVYLGHLACDLGLEAGRELWQTVVQQLPELAGPSPVARPDSQFLLALQLKGVLVFEPPDRRRAFLKRWEEEEPVKQFPEEQVRLHPFGLIRQAVALNYARCWEEDRQKVHADKALEYFESAFSQARADKPLLEVLAFVCKLRLYEFAVRARPSYLQLGNKLSGTLGELKGRLVGRFGPAAWEVDREDRSVGGVFGQFDPGGPSPVERVRSVLKAIRFNYW